MIPSSLARRYARALLDIGQAQGDYLALGDQLAAFARLMTESRDLRVALENPMFPLDKRRQVLDEVVRRTGAQPMLKNLLALLLERGRIGGVDTISAEYTKLADERAGRVKALVRTARPLGVELTAKLQKAIERSTGKQVELGTEVDPQLIGGIRMQIGSVVYDNTIRAQLARLRQRLLERT